MPARGKSNKAKGKPGAPSLLTSSVHDTIVRYLKAGADLDVASAAAGVSKRVALKWLRDGERLRRLKADEPTWEPRGGEVDLFRFAEAVDVARAEAELGDIVAVGMAARDRKTTDGRTVLGDWRAAAYRLDRRDRSRAATSHAAMTGGPGVGFTMSGAGDDGDDVSDEDIIEALAQRLDEIATRTSKSKVKR
jgi:hypothetical protein